MKFEFTIIFLFYVKLFQGAVLDMNTFNYDIFIFLSHKNTFILNY